MTKFDIIYLHYLMIVPVENEVSVEKKEDEVENQVPSSDQAFAQLCATLKYNSNLRTFFRNYGTIYVNRRCPETEMTLLSTAVQFRLFLLIKTILVFNADPCLTDPDGTTVLIKISKIRFYHSQRLAILKRSDQCKDVPDTDGRTALWWIVHSHAGVKSKGKRYFDTVFAGVLHQARRADVEGVTPLMLAIKMNFTAAVEILLGLINGRCWSDLNAMDKKGNSVESYTRHSIVVREMFINAQKEVQGDGDGLKALSSLLK